MATALLILAMLGADRPDWWTAPALKLDASAIVFTDRPDGSVTLDAASASTLAGMLERCRAYQPILDRQLATLYELHTATLAAAEATGHFEAQRLGAALQAESAGRWPLWQVAIVGLGAALAGGAVGYLVATVTP